MPTTFCQKKTVICNEYPAWKGEPSYPVMNDKNLKLLKRHINEAKTLKNACVAGRLGTFSYLNANKAILESLRLYKK